MLEPVLDPLLAVDTDSTHVKAVAAGNVVQPARSNAQCLVVIDCQIDVVEPGARYEVYWLRRDGVEPNHLPDEPRIESTRI